MIGDPTNRSHELHRIQRPGEVRLLSSDARQVWFWLLALLAVLIALSVFKDILLPFIAGMMLAYFLNPLADRLQAMGLSRVIAAALLVCVVGVFLVAALVLLMPVLSTQIEQLAKSLPSDIQRARRALEVLAQERFGSYLGYVQAALDRAIAELQSNGSSILAALAAALWSRGAALVNLASLILITPLVVFYLLVDWHPMLERVRLWLPRDHAITIEHLAVEVNDAVAAFIRGQGAICLCLGLFYAVGLAFAGLKYGMVIGLVTGALAFVPMIGWVLGTIVALGAAVMQFAPKFGPILTVFAVMVGGMVFDTAVLSPRLVGKKVGLHPVWLIFALFAFSYLCGFVGTLVAVPVSAAIAVLVRFGVARYLESDVYRGQARSVEPAQRETLR